MCLIIELFCFYSFGQEQIILIFFILFEAEAILALQKNTAPDTVCGGLSELEMMLCVKANARVKPMHMLKMPLRFYLLNLIENRSDV